MDPGSAFAEYLSPYRDCFAQKRFELQFDDYCRGLLSDLPRKCVEGIAPAFKMAVRTTQKFSVVSDREHESPSERLRVVIGCTRRVPRRHLGNVGIIDEINRCKKANKTLVCSGDTCGASADVPTASSPRNRGRLYTLLDAESFRAQSWTDDLLRRRDAGILDSMTHRLKWRIAMKQSARADASGIRFDLLTYDDRGQRFVAEVSASISVHAAVRVEAVQVDVLLPGMHVIFGTRVAIIRAVTAPQHWRAIIWRMRVLERWLTLVAAVGELTGEMK